MNPLSVENEYVRVHFKNCKISKIVNVNFGAFLKFNSMQLHKH